MKLSAATPPTLTACNFHLRALKAADAEDVLSLFGNEQVVRFHDQKRMTQITDAQSLLTRFEDAFIKGSAIRWGVTDINDHVIGTCGFAFRDAKRIAAIGYELHPTYWRRGLMYSALNLAIDFVYENLEVNRIEGATYVANTASSQLLLKVGFHEEGILRQFGYWKGEFHDLRMHSMIRKDWESSLHRRRANK